MMSQEMYSRVIDLFFFLVFLPLILLCFTTEARSLFKDIFVFWKKIIYDVRKEINEKECAKDSSVKEIKNIQIVIDVFKTDFIVNQNPEKMREFRVVKSKEIQFSSEKEINEDSFLLRFN